MPHWCMLGENRFLFDRIGLYGIINSLCVCPFSRAPKNYKKFTCKKCKLLLIPFKLSLNFKMILNLKNLMLIKNIFKLELFSKKGDQELESILNHCGDTHTRVDKWQKIYFFFFLLSSSTTHCI